MLNSRHLALLIKNGSCLFVGSALFLCGCGQDEVKAYRVAKPTQAAQSADPHGQGHDHSHGGAAPMLKYAKPEQWEEVEPGEMRAASFRLKVEGQGNADVGVFPLPGMAGGDLGNVNRWRGQVGLKPVTEEELNTMAEEVTVAGAKARLFDLAGETPGSAEQTRILAAILRREGMAWFFKMTGDDALVAAQKPAFKTFLESVEFSEQPQGLPLSHPPVQMAAGESAQGSAAGAAGTTSESAKPGWVVPQGWKEVPAGQFLAAKYQVTGEGGAEAAINVSVSAGEGGGVAGNVNRWRGQLGLEVLPEDQLKLEKLQVAAGEAVLTDMTGKDGRTGKPARVIGAIVPVNGRTWFYKLMGDEQIVEREKNAFIEFLKTAKY